MKNHKTPEDEDLEYDPEDTEKYKKRLEIQTDVLKRLLNPITEEIRKHDLEDDRLPSK